MREPPLRVRVLGHPVITVPVMGLGALTLYQWSQNMDFAVPGIAAIAAMALVGKAAEHRMQYLRWRQAWDSYADTAGPAPQGPPRAKLAIAVIVSGGFMAHEAGALEGLAAPVAGFGLLAAILLAGMMLVRWWRRSRRRAPPASRSDVVSVCASAVIAVPSMTDAYSRLPAHCWHVLNSGQN